MGATWAGPASRVLTFRPSPHAGSVGLPPAGRVHAYLLCSGKTRLSRSPGKGGLTALAIQLSPRTSSVLPWRVPAPSATTPNPSFHSRTPGPSFLHHFAAATTLGTRKPPNSQCRPGCDSPPSGQAARAPSPRPQRLHSQDPRLLTFWGPPPLSARQSCHVNRSTAQQGLAGGGDCEAARREGRARGGAGKLGAASAAGASDWERALRRAADSRPPQPAAEPSRAHSGRRDCSTAEKSDRGECCSS